MASSKNHILLTITHQYFLQLFFKLNNPYYLYFAHKLDLATYLLILYNY